MFVLRFDPRAIEFWAERSRESATARRIQSEIVPRAKQQGYLSKVDFVTLCEWNSTRPRARYRSNAEDFVREVTRVSFATPNERLRVQVLTLLNGVSLATASVLLHFCAPDSYPILDRNSLWSLQETAPPKFDFDFWWAYVQATRKLAKQARVSMRVLDRALWQYAAENQA
jgi:hypothetical protein